MRYVVLPVLGLGLILGGQAGCPEQDMDGDGYTSCAAGETGCDCDDADPGAYPGAAEVCNDGRDQNCDGEDIACEPITGAQDISEADFVVVGESEQDWLGASLDVGGDLNGDGYDDVVLGAPDVMEGDGRVFVFYGPVAGTLNAADADAILFSPDGDGVGYDVSSAGDINGDGFDDIVLGAPFGSGLAYGGGAVYVVHGPVYGEVVLSESTAVYLPWDADGTKMGRALISEGDLNGDGYDDIVVGSQFGTGSSEGIVVVVYGPVNESMPLREAADAIFYGNSGDEAGTSLAIGGDLNLDGVDDLLIGAPFADLGGNRSGGVYVLYGPVYGELTAGMADAILAGEPPDGTQAGSSVAGAGDINGDGLDDVLVGAYFNGASAQNAGSAYAVFGPISGTVDLGQADVRLLGENEGDHAGEAVSFAGDVNSDGYSDFLVGAEDNDTKGESSGIAYLFYGPVRGTASLSTADATFLGADGEQAGHAFSTPGDVNGDGNDDFMIGAVGHSSTGTNAGAAYLFMAQTEADRVGRIPI